MPNPLFNALGGNVQTNPMNNIMAQLNQFRASFRGDAKAEVQRLMQSGKVTPEQYNQAAQMAGQLMQMMGK